MAQKPRGIASRERVVRADNAQKALNYRRLGLSYTEIGRKMGFTEQRAHQLVTEELQRINKERSETAEEVCSLEDERLDGLINSFYPRALKGDLAACDRVLAIMARRAKMRGIDKEKAGFVGITNINANGSLTDVERAKAIQAVLSRSKGITYVEGKEFSTTDLGDGNGQSSGLDEGNGRPSADK